jgi:hypothetical protein
MFIKFSKEKILKNGDSVLTFEMDEDVKSAVEKKYNKKFSGNLAKLFILEALENALLEELRDSFEKAKKLNHIKKENKNDSRG